MFSRKELQVRISKVRQSKKRKRSSNHEVATKKARAKAMENRMEPVPLVSPILIALMSISLFGITETSPKGGVKVSN